MMSGTLHSTDASISPHQPAVIVTDSEHLNATRRFEPWELAFSNGGAIMDEIPMPNRDIHEQLAFRNNDSQPKNEDNESHIDVSFYFLAVPTNLCQDSHWSQKPTFYP